MGSEKSVKVYQALKNIGFEEGLCKEIAFKYMNTDFTAQRMIGYLKSMQNPSVEEVVDEMLAILSDRDRIVQKHEMEQAQSKINQVYQNGLE